MRTGFITRAARETGVTAATAYKWSKEEWFATLIAQMRMERDAALERRTANIYDTVMDQLEDRLNNGDEHVLATGELIRRKVPARDLAAIAKLMFDKRQELRADAAPAMSPETALGRIMDTLREVGKLGTPERAPAVDVVMMEVENGDAVVATVSTDPPTRPAPSPLSAPVKRGRGRPQLSKDEKKPVRRKIASTAGCEKTVMTAKGPMIDLNALRKAASAK